jgi:hypothetical protein
MPGAVDAQPVAAAGLPAMPANVCALRSGHGARRRRRPGLVRRRTARVDAHRRLRLAGSPLGLPVITKGRSHGYRRPLHVGTADRGPHVRGKGTHVVPHRQGCTRLGDRRMVETPTCLPARPLGSRTPGPDVRGWATRTWGRARAPCSRPGLRPAAGTGPELADPGMAAQSGLPLGAHLRRPAGLVQEPAALVPPARRLRRRTHPRPRRTAGNAQGVPGVRDRRHGAER